MADNNSSEISRPIPPLHATVRAQPDHRTKGSRKSGNLGFQNPVDCPATKVNRRCLRKAKGKSKALAEGVHPPHQSSESCLSPFSAQLLLGTRFSLATVGLNHPTTVWAS